MRLVPKSKVVEALQDYVPEVRHSQATAWATTLYDAIEAGEIPGVRCETTGRMAFLIEIVTSHQAMLEGPAHLDEDQQREHTEACDEAQAELDELWARFKS